MPPQAAPIPPSWSSQRYLPLALVDMTRELADLAQSDARFERAAVLAMAVPHLAPTSVAEVRAAIMFALETAGADRPPMLPPPGHSGDLFEGAIQGVNHLPAKERETVVLRTGVGDRIYDIDEVARAVGCSREQVPQLERHALNTLLSQPGPLEACWKFEDLCAHLGLAWEAE